ncbi:MAG: gamma-glutamyltransferase, partial [Candidatus Zixiibacteriota bacterium]
LHAKNEVVSETAVPARAPLQPDQIKSLTRLRGRCFGQGQSGIIATAHPSATEIGLSVLSSGGNAVDAAVAAAWALSVCEPSGSGLGGQTTMLIHFPDGHQTVLDGHSRAPKTVSKKTVRRSHQKRGYRACTIPSTPAALGAASRRYGRLSLSEVIEPAVQLAENGFRVSRLFRRQVQWCKAQLRTNEPALDLLFDDRKVLRKGALFRQPALAHTLSRLAAQGVEDFYQGELARDIANDMRECGGLLTEDDLNALELPKEWNPISTTFRGHRVVTVPPPGGGLQVLQCLSVFEQLHREGMNLYDWYRTIARIIEVVYHYRWRWPLHPDNVPASMFSWLAGEERARELALVVSSSERLPIIKDRVDGGETTHLCVADKDGLVVSLTQSIQSLYGAKVANRKLGFFYNNYLMTCPRQAHECQLAAGALPRSNVAPTIVLRQTTDGTELPILALGAAGSRRITSSVMQIVINRLVLGMSLPEAVDAPRIHGTLTNKAYIEKRMASKEIIELLSRDFRQVEVKASRSYSMGGAQAVAREPDGSWIGMADPRREGTADGY